MQLFAPFKKQEQTRVPNSLYIRTPITNSEPEAKPDETVKPPIEAEAT